ncbi:hypothetical protein NDU88_001176 [Pleurodeles waltl]|uniref:Uncharacterized protein n=1 Tax=Pleurodeles waltl TaxID=8319 RepID=A0AAV7U650_PLEWA|nr:hypothetical protein NDU88_001176 [Pleurodeles waltl]
MSRCAKLLGDAVGANSTVPMKNYLWLDPVYEDTFSGAANILEADSASEDVMDNYDIPGQEVKVSKDHPDNLGRNVTYRSRLGVSCCLLSSIDGVWLFVLYKMVMACELCHATERLLFVNPAS